MDESLLGASGYPLVTYKRRVSSAKNDATTSTEKTAAESTTCAIEVAAAKQFAKHGYEGTALKGIARAAHVPKPVVYQHFDSKEALYLALLARHREQMPSFAAPAPESLPCDCTKRPVPRGSYQREMRFCAIWRSRSTRYGRSSRGSSTGGS